MRNRPTTRFRFRSLASLVSLASLLFCGVALADGEPEEVDEAREHFRRGIELFNEGNADAAFVELSRAYEISNNYRLLYNLAQVQAERHDYVAAMALFRQYLERGGDEVETARRETVEKELELLAKRVSSLELTLNVAGAEVFLNGVRQEVSGREAKLQLNAGMVRLEVRKKGYESHLEEVNVAGGEARQLAITLKEEPDATLAPAPLAPTQEAAPAPEVSYNYTPFWIGFASTALLGGAAATFGVFTLEKEKALNEEFDRFPGDLDAQAQRRNDLKTMATVTDAFSAATIVAGGISLYLLFDPPKEDEPEQGAELTGFILRPSGVDLCGSF
jgi:tetratricopeptide (TPR) repeat protein